MKGKRPIEDRCDSAGVHGIVINWSFGFVLDDPLLFGALAFRADVNERFGLTSDGATAPPVIEREWELALSQIE